MAWIESHDTLARHPKTRRAARALGVSVPTMIGHLHCLWWWALEYAEDGSLSAFDAVDVADGAMWDGEPETLITALCQVGFLDQDAAGGLSIHDWAEYTGRLLDMRRANAEKQRRWRDKHRPAPAPVTDTSPEDTPSRNGYVTVTQPLRNGTTVPYPTVPNQTEPIESDLPLAPAPPREEPVSPPPANITPLPVPKSPPRPPTAPGFTVTPEHRALAAELFVDVDVEAAKFRDHCAASGKTYRDYAAAFRNWLRRAPVYTNGARAGPPPKGPPIPIVHSWD